MNKQMLQAEVSHVYKQSWELIKSRERGMDVVAARHAYIYLAVTLLKQSQIATALDVGKSDESIISYVVKKITGFMKVNDPQTEKIKTIISNLK